MMMKSALVLGILFQILGGSSVSAFQTSKSPSRTATAFQQTTTSLQPPSASRQLTLLSTVVAEYGPLTKDAAGILNPWDRVCTTVQSTTDQLNAVRKRVTKSGVATAISYSLVSNCFTSVAVSLAWYGFSKQSGLSPISPGQWKPFLAWYGGFYAVNSLLKPIRFMVALGVVPYTEQVMQTFQEQFDSRKATIACTTTLLVLVSSGIMASGIGLASLVSGTPIFPSS